MSETLEARYERLASDRLPFEERAREASALTIPTLIPPKGHSHHSKMPKTYQSLGAQGVQHLASKLLLALFPPSSPFFRLIIDDYSLEKLTEEEGKRAEIDEKLSTIERAVAVEVDRQAHRVIFLETLKHLVVSGNSLVQIMDDGKARMFPITSYVVIRDPTGTLLELIFVETISREALSDELKAEVGADKPEHEKKTEFTVYTQLKLKGGKYEVTQEINKTQVESSKGSYAKDKLPFMPLCWIRYPGENYGRGLVEQYIGDLRSFEALSEAMAKVAAIAAKILFLVRPGSATNPKTLNNAPSGAYVPGSRADIESLQLDKVADFNVARQQAGEIAQRLSRVFLMQTSIQRDAERVTASEISYMSRELEETLGGIYSALSQEFQLPLVKNLLNSMQRRKLIPALPEDIIQPTIVTGTAALGRGQELETLNALISQIAALGPDAISKYLNLGDYFKRIGTALGIDMDGLIRSQDEVSNAENNEQVMQMLMNNPAIMQMLQGGMAEQPPQ